MKEVLLISVTEYENGEFEVKMTKKPINVCHTQIVGRIERPTKNEQKVYFTQYVYNAE